MPLNDDMARTLFSAQLASLQSHHMLILYWAAEAEVLGVKYSITNVFDDMKAHNITRTKQSVMAYVDTLKALCFIHVKDERNRKNIYLSEYGAMALECMADTVQINNKQSRYLEEQK